MHQISIQIGKKSFANFEAGLRHAETALETAVAWAAQPVSAELKRALQLVAQKVRAEHGQPWNGGVVNFSERLQSRSGEALAAMDKSVKVTGARRLDNVSGSISSGFWAIHETGGVIRAQSKYLTIPLPAAMDARGIPLKKRARDWLNTFVAKSRKGNLIIFQKRGRKDIAPLYLLKPEVRIRPRLNMQDTIERVAVPYFDQKAIEVIERVITERMGG